MIDTLNYKNFLGLLLFLAGIATVANFAYKNEHKPLVFEQVTYVTINAIGTSCISLIKSKLMRKKLNNPQLLLRQP